jgi:HlyD family secretion protein
MKQTIVIIVAALVLVAGGTLIVLSSEQMPNLLPEAVPAGQPTGLPNSVTTRGKVVPLTSVALSFPGKGLEEIVSEVLVKEGDHVEAGAVLAALDKRDLELGVEEARAVLAQAQANYDRLIAGATPQEIEQARIQLAQAQAKVHELASNVLPQDIVAAQAELDAARAALAQAQAGPKSSSVQAAQAALDQARARLQSERDRLSAEKTKAQLTMEQAANDLRTRQDTYSRIHWENQAQGSDIDQQSLDREAAALRDMQDAATALEQARIAYEQARQAEISGVAAAEAAVKNAEAALADLTAGVEPDAIAAARARLAQAEANMARLYGDQDAGALAAAAAEQQHAQAVLDILTNGPREIDLASAAAQVQQAEVALKRSQLALDLAVLRAPISGTIVEINIKVGEVPSINGPALVLADLSNWRIEVDELNEQSIVTIREGDPAMIRFDALPNLELPGRVSYVKAMGQSDLDTLDTHYTAIVLLDQQDQRLRWNMSATVTIEPTGVASQAPPQRTTRLQAQPTTAAQPTTRPIATPTPPAQPTAPLASASPTSSSPTTLEYRVQEGDILKAIAQRYGVTVQEIMAINQIENPDSLRVGEILRIPQK